MHVTSEAWSPLLQQESEPHAFTSAQEQQEWRFFHYVLQRGIKEEKSAAGVYTKHNCNPKMVWDLSSVHLSDSEWADRKCQIDFVVHYRNVQKNCMKKKDQNTLKIHCRQSNLVCWYIEMLGPYVECIQNRTSDNKMGINSRATIVD